MRGCHLALQEAHEKGRSYLAVVPEQQIASILSELGEIGRMTQIQAFHVA
jgi:hypothetical protein